MLDTVQKYLLLGFTFIFPIFFLPVTQEFFATNKFYLLAVVMLVVSLISVVKFISSKKIHVRRHFIYLPLFLLVAALALSVLFQSPNPQQALAAPATGLLAFVFLALYTFHLRDKNLGLRALEIGYYSAGVLALVTIVFFLNPLAHTNLPAELAFLKNSTFSPLGLQVDVAAYLGFFVIVGLTRIKRGLTPTKVSNPKKSANKRPRGIKGAIAQFSAKKAVVSRLLLTLFILVALVISIYNQIFQLPDKSADKSLNKAPRLSIVSAQFLPPANVSWNAAVDTLKGARTALFGVGVDNFASAFTRAKSASYNSQEYWNLNFNRSRSTLLHLWTTGGLLTLIALIALLGLMFKSSLSDDLEHSLLYLPLTLYVIGLMLFVPLSLPVLILFFLSLSAIHKSEKDQGVKTLYIEARKHNREVVMITVVGVSLILIGGAAYFLGNVYAGEYNFKKSLDAVQANKATQAYQAQIQAIKLSPFVERYHMAFSQVNLLVANSLFQSLTEGKREVTDRDRSTITQAVQQAIQEAKLAVQLNPQKASHWENLAAVYRNIIGVAQGADQWSLSSYTQAINADPANPALRFALGSLQYSMQNYDAAENLFIQAIRLKSDWANAYYNLAWTYQQKGQTERAVIAMQEVLRRVEVGGDEYDRAADDLETFKKNLPEQPKDGKGELSLPKNTGATLNPELELPQEASPPADLTTPTPTPTPEVSPTPEAEVTLSEEEQVNENLDQTPTPTLTPTPTP